MTATKGIGRRVQIGLAKEASRGTAQSSATYWTPWSDLTIDEKKEFAIDDQTYGVIEDSVALDETKKWAEGSLAGNIEDENFGLILFAALGSHSVATHSGESTVYDHTFTVGQSAQHQSLTFFLHDPLAAQDYKYANGVIDKLEITAALKKFVAFNATIKTLSGATASSFTPSTTTENRFLPQHLTATFADDVSDLGSGTAVALQSMKLTISGNTEDQEVLGSTDPADFLNKEFSVEGSFEAIWKGEGDFKTEFMGPTPQAIKFDFLNDDATIGNASNPDLAITLAKVTFQELSRPFKVKDLVYQTVSFKATYSISDTSMISVLLTNTVSSY